MTTRDAHVERFPVPGGNAADATTSSRVVLRHAVLDAQPVMPGRRLQPEARTSLGQRSTAETAPRPGDAAADIAVEQPLRSPPPPSQGMAASSLASTSKPAPSSASAFDLGVAEGLSRARAERDKWSQNVMTQARQEVDARTDRMRKELEQEAQQAYQARVQSLDQMLGALPEQIAQRLSAMEDDILALTFASVCRVLGDAFVDPSFVQRHLRQAMAEYQGRPLTAVHLHPHDLARLRQDLQALPATLVKPELQWIEDSSLTSGGCILQSPDGALDARLATQLKALAALLTESRSAI